jgi:hypothetical protein
MEGITDFVRHNVQLELHFCYVFDILSLKLKAARILINCHGLAVGYMYTFHSQD